MSAPTTAEVRAEIAHEQRLGVGSLNSRCAALKHYALPLAEHRDALAAEVARLRSVLGNIATLDESDTDDLTEALTNWDVADVYASLGAAITSARMALDDAAKGAGR